MQAGHWKSLKTSIVTVAFFDPAAFVGSMASTPFTDTTVTGAGALSTGFAGAVFLAEGACRSAAGKAAEDSTVKTVKS